MQTVIEVKDLTKNFRDIHAVDRLTFSVAEGEVYGFLGQNGAGKSTTIRMLLTLIKPSEGSISIFGMDLHKKRNEILRQVGAVIERPDLYKYLTGLENLRIFAAMSGVRVNEKRLMEQLEQVGLAERANSKVKTYSQGMKQRLGIATALIHDPKLIVLDEPTNGLDPQGIADIRNLILHLSIERKKTILVSSHLLSEIEMIADSMLIIDKGKKLVEGKSKELFDPSSTIVELTTTNDDQSWKLLQDSPLQFILHQYRNDCIVLKANRDELATILQQLVTMKIPVTSFTPQHSLEAYFLSLTTGRQHVDTFKN